LRLALGFVFRFALAMVPLLRAGFSVGRALRQVLLADALSIAVMEGVEVLVALYTPGVMEAHVTHPRFWGGMALGLAAGFVAAYPVNYLFVSRGIRHQHWSPEGEGPAERHPGADSPDLPVSQPSRFLGDRPPNLSSEPPCDYTHGPNCVGVWEF
jgi:hypothetical protein